MYILTSLEYIHSIMVRKSSHCSVPLQTNVGPNGMSPGESQHLSYQRPALQLRTPCICLRT